ncbi:membrane protein [soil metagenome]
MSAIHTPHTPWRRLVGVGVGLATAVTVIVLAFSWPAVTSDVHDLPVAISGDAARIEQVESAFESNAPDTFDFVTVDNKDAAVDAIESRAVYGAVLLSQSPEVLTSSAASATVAQLLGGVATQLQAQAQAGADAAAAAAGFDAPTITVQVTDVVPLADADPRGAGLASAVFPLVIGGMLGGILITTVVVGAWRRLVTLFVYAGVAGLVVPAILQGWFGVLQGDYIVNVGVFALALLAIGAPIVGLAALVGRAGIAIGPVLFLLIGNPISSANAPLEFLPQPWGLVGQYLPPGAGATLLRDASYFPQANVAFPILVLGAWAFAGVVLGLVGHFRASGGATQAALDEAGADSAGEERLVA